MSPRARDRYGLGTPGAEVRWKGGKPERPKRPKSERKPRPRRRPSPPRPKPTTCAQITCPYLKAPVLPGRVVCEGCAEKLDKRAAELRKREEARMVDAKRAGVREHPTHDREVSPDA